MARRGKVKYKDVVKKPHMSQKKSQKKTKPRKTYSLYSNNSNKSNIQKRKFVPRQSSYEPEPKQQKIERNIPRQEEESSASEEDVADLDNLLNTFKDPTKSKKSLAIDSSNDSESESEENNQNNEALVEQEEDVESDLDTESETQEVSDDETLENTEGKIEESDGDEVDDVKIEINEKEEEEIDDNADPYNKHVLFDLHDSMLDSLQSSPVSTNNSTESWPVLGNLNIQIPKCDNISSEETEQFTIAEKKVYAPEGMVPKRIKPSNLNDLHIKTQIINNLLKVNKTVTDSEHFTPLQGEIFAIINNYQDLYYPERTFSNSEEIRYTYCVHAVNHILKTRLKVIHHNSRLTKKDEVPEEFRDQGLVRPKVNI